MPVQTNLPSIAVCITFALAAGASAQVPLDPVRDWELVSHLDAHASSERTVPCDILTYPPHLNFDFRFQAGYTLYVPLKHFTGAGNGLSVVTRITPTEPASEPVYLSQTMDLPDIPHKNRAELQLAGGYFVGEGKYKLDLMMLDQDGRACRKHWAIEARRSGQSKEIPLRIASGTVAPFTFATWKARSNQRETVPAGERQLTVLFHVAPMFRWNTSLRTWDQEMLLGSLGSLLEQIPCTRVKLVAFNLDQQKELFRQDDFDSDGFDRLLEAMEKLQLGTVSYGTLAQTAGHVDLLKKLVDEELAGESRSDAVIFLGPSARQSDKPALPLRHVGSLPQPLFFYFEYKPFWFRSADFPDVVYHLTRALAGKVFRIHSPSDFASAIRSVRASLDEKQVQGTR